MLRILSKFLDIGAQKKSPQKATNVRKNVKIKFETLEDRNVPTTAVAVIDFGDNGVWRWSQTTGFDNIHPANVEGTSADDNGFAYIDFGVNGLWRWSQATGFLQISAVNPENIDAGPNGF